MNVLEQAAQVLHEEALACLYSISGRFPLTMFPVSVARVVIGNTLASDVVSLA